MNQVTTNKSNTITEIAKSLSQFQSECPVLQKGSQGYGYKYADLPSIVQTINPILKKCGLCFTQLTGGTQDEVSVTTTQLTGGTQDEVSVTTILIHSKSGEYFETTISSSLKANTGKMSAIQATGSIITYLRRYSIASILGIVTDEDIDRHVQKPSINALLDEVRKCKTKEELKSVWDTYEDYHTVKEFVDLVTQKNQSFGNSAK